MDVEHVLKKLIDFFDYMLQHFEPAFYNTSIGELTVISLSQSHTLAFALARSLVGRENALLQRGTCGFPLPQDNVLEG